MAVLARVRFGGGEHADEEEEMELESGNIVERLRALATHLDEYPREKIEDEILEAADVIERLRAQLDKLAPHAAEAAGVAAKE